ncbi:SDR family oxidoreductase [Deinococcus sp. UYEF24]
MIIVTGATGKLGRAVVQQLLTRVAATDIGVSVRDPLKAQDLQERGVRVRKGDFTDPDSLRRAFEGATQVLIVSSGTLGAEGLRLNQNVIGAAREAGARRLLYTSHMAASHDSLFPPMWTHAGTEDLLRQSGLPFTSLRNGFYADSARFLLGQAFQTGEVTAPPDGPVSWTTHADLAQAAAVILADEGRFEGATPPLTSSEALDLAQLGEIVSSLTGRPSHRTVVPEDGFRAGLVERGMPPERIAITVGLYAASQRGEFAAVDPTLARLLGREPQSMREVLAQQEGTA